MTRDTGKPLEGHVEAANAESAYQVLSESGIVTEALREDPKAMNLSPEASPLSEFTEALESALDSSSSQVAFDDLTERYRGKKVWVIDRHKIRERVAQVVDTTLAASEADSESGAATRQRVANAISGLFHDNRNIASERSSESIAGMKVTGGGGDLAQQIGRLTGVVEQAERLISMMKQALANADSGGGAPRRRASIVPSLSDEQNSVLREILQSNLDLRKAIANQPTSESTQTEV
ncbi:MAG TPA: hypothetical protein VH518_03720 [Tepidisphaeraceae bacterium]